MKTEEKLKRLNSILLKASESKFYENSDPLFIHWRSEVERTLEKIYGRTSIEFSHFSRLRFSYTGPRMMNKDYSMYHRRYFESDYKLLKENLAGYIKEIETYEIDNEKNSNTELGFTMKKIFISHAAKDKAIIEEIIELIESIGISSDQIFCSSFEGYGISLGENFLEQIKKELSSDVLVFFVLTENFYESKVCLCEMGAAWALSKDHIPIVIPPLTYSDIQAVIPLTQGLVVNDAAKLNSFKDKLENDFEIENRLSFSSWERKRDRFIRDIDTHLSTV